MIPIISIGSILSHRVTLKTGVYHVTDITNIEVEITVPVGFMISDTVASVGSFSGTTWTIPAWPAGADATLDMDFEATLDCPTGTDIVATVVLVDPPANPNTDNDTYTYVLEYYTCCDWSCSPEATTLYTSDGDMGSAVRTISYPRESSVENKLVIDVDSDNFSPFSMQILVADQGQDASPNIQLKTGESKTLFLDSQVLQFRNSYPTEIRSNGAITIRARETSADAVSEFVIGETAMTVAKTGTGAFTGVVYADDYSAGFVDLSLVNKAWVLAQIPPEINSEVVVDTSEYSLRIAEIGGDTLDDGTVLNDFTPYLYLSYGNPSLPPFARLIYEFVQYPDTSGYMNFREVSLTALGRWKFWGTVLMDELQSPKVEPQIRDNKVLSTGSTIAGIGANEKALTTKEYVDSVLPSEELFTGITDVEENVFDGRVLTGIRNVDGDEEGFVGVFSEPGRGSTVKITFQDTFNSYLSFLELYGDGLHLEGNKSSIDLGGDGIILNPKPSQGGAKYDVDHSASYTDRSLVDKAYVDASIPAPELFNGVTEYEDTEEDSYTQKGIRHVDGNIESFIGITSEVGEGAPIRLATYDQVSTVNSVISIGLSGINIDGAASGMLLGNFGIVVSPAASTGGVRYNTDHSASYSIRSLIDKGFLDARAPQRIRSGSAVFSTDASGDFFIPHGLGVIPLSVQLTLVDNDPGGTISRVRWLKSASTSTHIVGRLFNSSGPDDLTSREISWIATSN